MTLSQSLKKLFGSVNFSEREIDKHAYASDFSDNEGNASHVVWPKNIEEVHKLVNLCKRSSATLTPRGAGTGLAGGSVPNDSIIVDLSKMRKILEIGDEYALVEAGCPLSKLNQELGYKLFPVQPESRASCTIGGMVATNAMGLRAMEFGRMLDWVEELNVIDGNGMLLKLKGDAIKHFCGAEGTTGIIVSARLRLTRQEEKTTSVFHFNTLTAMYEKVKELRNVPEVKNIEFVDEYCSELLDFGESNHLIVEYSNGKGKLKGDNAENVWAARREIPKLLRNNKFCIMEDAQVSQPAKFIYWLSKNGLPSFGPIGVDIIHPVMKDRLLYQEMKNTLKRLDGKLGAKFGYGSAKREYLSKKDAKRLTALKAYYDPKNLMNRGKLI